MKKTIRSFFTAAISLATLLITGSAWAVAPTPLVVWDEDFASETKSGFTLSVRGGEEISADRSYVEIKSSGRANAGLSIIKSDNSNIGVNATGTVIFKVSNLPSTIENAFLISLRNAGKNDPVGIFLDNTTSGVLKPALISGGDPTATRGTEFNNDSGTHTFAVVRASTSTLNFYEIVNGTPITLATFTGTNTNPNPFSGFVLGGMWAGSGQGIVSATGMKIEAVAVFSDVLTGEQAAAYKFPSEPVAMWDGDFNVTTKGDWTLDVGENLLATDNKSITILAGKKGVLLDRSAAIASPTIIVRYENFSYPETSGNYFTLVTSSLGSDDRTGISANGVDHKARAIWASADNDTDGIPKAIPSSGKFGFVYATSGTRGTYLYDGEGTQLYGATGLKSDNDGAVKGFAVGGNRSNATLSSNKVKPCGGMVITGIAVFDRQLTGEEIAAFKFSTSKKVGDTAIWSNFYGSQSINGYYTKHSGTLHLPETADCPAGTKVAVKKISFAEWSGSAWGSTITLNNVASNTGVQEDFANSGKTDITKMRTYTFSTPVEIEVDKDYTATTTDCRFTGIMSGSLFNPSIGSGYSSAYCQIETEIVSIPDNTTAKATVDTDVKNEYIDFESLPWDVTPTKVLNAEITVTGSKPLIIEPLNSDAVAKSITFKGESSVQFKTTGLYNGGKITSAIPLVLNAASSIEVDTGANDLTYSCIGEISPAISTTGAFTKDGTGTLVIDPTAFKQASQTIAINGGTLKISKQANDGQAFNCTINAGGVLDLNGYSDNWQPTITLNGGKIINSAGHGYGGTGKKQIKGLNVTENSTIDNANEFGIVGGGYVATTLVFTDGKTLTKSGNGTFHIIKTTLSGAGTLAVKGGEFHTSNAGSSFADGTIELDGGSVKLDANLTTKNLVYKGGSITNPNSLTVSNKVVCDGAAIPVVPAGNYSVEIKGTVAANEVLKNLEKTIALVDDATLDCVGITLPFAGTIASASTGKLVLPGNFVSGSIAAVEGGAEVPAGLTAEKNGVPVTMTVIDGMLAVKTTTVSKTVTGGGTFTWSEIEWDGGVWEDDMIANVTTDANLIFNFNAATSGAIVLKGSGDVTVNGGEYFNGSIDATGLTGKVIVNSANNISVNGGGNAVEYTYTGSNPISLGITNASSYTITTSVPLDFDAGDSDLTYNYTGLTEATATLSSSGTVTFGGTGIIKPNTSVVLSSTKVVINKGATVKYVLSADAVPTNLASLTFDGEGTLIINGSNRGKPEGKITNFASTWTGLAWIQDFQGGNERTPWYHGTVNSTVRYTHVQGWLRANRHDATASGISFEPTVELLDDTQGVALDINNGNGGWQDNRAVEFAALVGDGTMNYGWVGQGVGGYALVIRDISKFEGSLTSANAKSIGIAIGASATWESTDQSKIVLLSDATATIPNDKSWAAVNGIFVNGTIGGAGMLSSATTFGAGATLDCTKGTLSLASGKTVSFGSTLNVTLPQDATADDYKILTLTNAAEKYIAVEVSVAGDDEKEYILEQRTDGVYLVEVGEDGIVINVPENDEVAKTLIPGYNYKKTGEGMLLVKGTIAGTLTISAGEAVIMPGASVGTITKSGTGKDLYGYTVNVNNCGKFAIPSGKAAGQIRIFDAVGNPLDITDSDERYVYFDWEITDDACWWDYEFNGNGNNTGTDGTALRWDEGRPGGADFTDDGKLYAVKRPWRDVSTWPSVATFVMYGTMPSNDNRYYVVFGSSGYGTYNTIFLATDKVSEDKVVLCKANGRSGDKDHLIKLCTMTVPNAQSADHLYAFVLKSNDTQTIIDIYLDGELLQSYPFGEVINLGTGFQFASPHGGEVVGYSRPENTDQATLDWLRVYDLELTKEALEKYAREYPYVSPNGSYQRTVREGDVWTATDAWTREGEDPEQADAPASGATVKITSEGAIVEEEKQGVVLGVNLESDVAYEAIRITGDDLKIARSSGETTGKIVSTGRVTANANVTFAYNAFSMAGAPLTVKQGKTVTFDLSMVDMTQFFSTQTYDLTGYLTLEEDANVAFIVPKELYGRTATAAIDGTTKHYVLTITVPDNTFTYTDGAWTWGTQSVDAKIVTDNPGTAIVVESGTLEWPMDRASFTVNGGSLKATAAPTVACAIAVNAGAAFDVNGKGSTQYAITLNGGELANTGAGTFVSGLTVTDDSSVNLTSGLSIQSSDGGWDLTTIALGENTLTKKGDGQFTLVMTTITGTGTLDIQSGKVYSSESTTFADGTIKIASGATYQQRGARTTTVAKIIGVDGAILQNNSSEGAGTMSAFTLEGALKLDGAGTFGTITLDKAALDIATQRGLTLAGTGSVKATITAAELEAGTATVFKKTEDATIDPVTLVDEAGEELTGYTADYDEEGNYKAFFTVAITGEAVEHYYYGGVTYSSEDGTKKYVPFDENFVAKIPYGSENVIVAYVVEDGYTFSTGSAEYDIELGTVSGPREAKVPADVTVGLAVAQFGTFPHVRLFTSLASAVAAAEAGTTIAMITSDENEAAISKSLTIDVGGTAAAKNSINVSITANEGTTINLARGGIVTGTIAVDGGTVNFQTANDNITGEFTGTLNYTSGTVTRNADYAVEAPEGYLWYGTDPLTLISSEFTWIGASGDDWNDPDNWQGGIVPVEGSKAIINLGDDAGEYTINLPENTAELASLTLSGSATSFAFTGTGSLNATSYDISGLTATTLDLSKTTFNANYTIPANSTLIVNGAVWTSEATLGATTSKFRYDGAYTAINGTFAGEKGTVELGGTLNASGNITLGSTTVQYAFDGNITVNGVLTVGSSNGSVAYFNRGTINATTFRFGGAGSTTGAQEQYFLGDGASDNDTMVITANMVDFTTGNYSTGLRVYFRRGSTVKIGAGGMSKDGSNPFYRQWFLQGGKIVITDTCSMLLKELKEVSGETELEVLDEKTLTLTIVPQENGMTRSGSVRKTGKGSIVFANNPVASFTIADGVAVVDAGNERSITVTDDGVLKVKVTDAQWINGYTSTATIPENNNIVFVAPDGTEIANTEGKVLPPKPADRTWKGGASGEWNVAANWTPEGVPSDGESVEIDSTAAAIAITVPNDGVTIGGITFKGDNAITLTGGAINAGIVAKVGADRTEFVGGTIATSIQVVGGTLAISGDYTLPSAIATESGTTLELDVASAKTINSVISGAGAVKKTGKGELVLNAANTFKGGLAITEGTVKAGNVNGLGSDSSGNAGKGEVYVSNGATLDTNGQKLVNTIYLIGDGVDGNGALIDNAADMGSSVATKIRLTGDASWGGSKYFHFGNASDVQLNGFAFTKKGQNAFPLNNTTIRGPGKIVVAEGTFDNNSGNSTLDQVDLEVLAGATLRMKGTSLTIRDFIFNEGAFIDNNTATLKVNGTLFGAVTIPKLELANGATIKLVDGETVEVTDTFTKGGALNLDLSGLTTLFDGTKLVKWPDVAADTFATVTWPVAQANAGLEVRDGWLVIKVAKSQDVIEIPTDPTQPEGEKTKVVVDASFIQDLANAGLPGDTPSAKLTAKPSETAPFSYLEGYALGLSVEQIKSEPKPFLKVVTEGTAAAATDKITFNFYVGNVGNAVTPRTGVGKTVKFAVETATSPNATEWSAEGEAKTENAVEVGLPATGDTKVRYYRPVISFE